MQMGRLFQFVIVVFDGDQETKVGTYAGLAADLNFSLKLLQDQLGDSQTQTHPASVNVFSLCYLPKELKQLGQVLLLYTDTCVLYLGHKSIISELNSDSDRSLKRELDCISEQVKEYLLVPLLVIEDLMRDIILYVDSELDTLLLKGELQDL